MKHFMVRHLSIETNLYQHAFRAVQMKLLLQAVLNGLFRQEE